MPEWLRTVARANPLTYLVDALRMLMIEGGQGAHSLVMNFTVLGVVFVVFVVVAARLYPTLIKQGLRRQEDFLSEFLTPYRRPFGQAFVLSSMECFLHLVSVRHAFPRAAEKRREP